jgi:hypothetical protein
MAEGTTRSPRVARDVFAKAVHDSKIDGTGPKGIAEKTGMKLNSVNTRLVKLRQMVGKDNVPNFQTGGGNKVTDAEKAMLIAIMNPQTVA